MKNKIPHSKYGRHFFLSAITGLLLAISLPSIAQEQAQRVVEGERPTCKVTVNNKDFHPQLNQVGCFDRISNIPEDKPVNIEISYPKGKEGDKIVVSLDDGGTLDNGRQVEVVYLDQDKKFSFTFKAIPNDPGIYRITLLKGNDEKTIRLWVGPEIPLAKK